MSADTQSKSADENWGEFPELQSARLTIGRITKENDGQLVNVFDPESMMQFLMKAEEEKPGSFRSNLAIVMEAIRCALEQDGKRALHPFLREWIERLLPELMEAGLQESTERLLRSRKRGEEERFDEVIRNPMVQTTACCAAVNPIATLERVANSPDIMDSKLQSLIVSIHMEPRVYGILRHGHKRLHRKLLRAMKHDALENPSTIKFLVDCDPATAEKICADWVEYSSPEQVAYALRLEKWRDMQDQNARTGELYTINSGFCGVLRCMSAFNENEEVKELTEKMINGVVMSCGTYVRKQDSLQAAPTAKMLAFEQLVLDHTDSDSKVTGSIGDVKLQRLYRRNLGEVTKEPYPAKLHRLFDRVTPQTDQGRAACEEFQDVLNAGASHSEGELLGELSLIQEGLAKTPRFPQKTGPVTGYGNLLSPSILQDLVAAQTFRYRDLGNSFFPSFSKDNGSAGRKFWAQVLMKKVIDEGSVSDLEENYDNTLHVLTSADAILTVNQASQIDILQTMQLLHCMPALPDTLIAKKPMVALFSILVRNSNNIDFYLEGLALLSADDIDELRRQTGVCSCMWHVGQSQTAKSMASKQKLLRLLHQHALGREDRETYEEERESHKMTKGMIRGGLHQLFHGSSRKKKKVQTAIPKVMAAIMSGRNKAPIYDSSLPPPLPVERAEEWINRTYTYLKEQNRYRITMKARRALNWTIHTTHGRILAVSTAFIGAVSAIGYTYRHELADALNGDNTALVAGGDNSRIASNGAMSAENPERISDPNTVMELSRVPQGVDRYFIVGFGDKKEDPATFFREDLAASDQQMARFIASINMGSHYTSQLNKAPIYITYSGIPERNVIPMPRDGNYLNNGMPTGSQIRHEHCGLPLNSGGEDVTDGAIAFPYKTPMPDYDVSIETLRERISSRIDVGDFLKKSEPSLHPDILKSLCPELWEAIEKARTLPAHGACMLITRTVRQLFQYDEDLTYEEITDAEMEPRQEGGHPYLEEIAKALAGKSSAGDCTQAQRMTEESLAHAGIPSIPVKAYFVQSRTVKEDDLHALCGVPMISTDGRMYLELYDGTPPEEQTPLDAYIDEFFSTRNHPHTKTGLLTILALMYSMQKYRQHRRKPKRKRRPQVLASEEKTPVLPVVAQRLDSVARPVFRSATRIHQQVLTHAAFQERAAETRTTETYEDALKKAWQEHVLDAGLATEESLKNFFFDPDDPPADTAAVAARFAASVQERAASMQELQPIARHVARTMMTDGSEEDIQLEMVVAAWLLYLRENPEALEQWAVRMESEAQDSPLPRFLSHVLHAHEAVQPAPNPFADIDKELATEEKDPLEGTELLKIFEHLGAQTDEQPTPLTTEEATEVLQLLSLENT